MNKQHLNESVERILILHTAFLGDIILTLPLLQETHRRFPNAEIDFLTIPPSRNLLANNPIINKVIVYDKHSRNGRIQQLWQTGRELKARQYDLALVPHRSLRSALLIWLASIPHSIGFSSSAGKWPFSQTVDRRNDLHEVDRNLALLAPLGYEKTNPVYPQLYFEAADHMAVEAILESSLTERPLVAVAPGSVWATKRWLPERFAGLCDRIYESGMQAVLVGGPADAKTIDNIKAVATSPLVDTVGQLSLRQSALLISHCRLLITNDSAPLHLAVSVRRPVIAIFGATVPSFGFYPYGPQDRIVETELNLDCRPCGSHGHHQCPIKTFECMKSISVDQAYDVINEILQNEEYNEPDSIGG